MNIKIFLLVAICLKLQSNLYAQKFPIELVNAPLSNALEMINKLSREYKGPRLPPFVLYPKYEPYTVPINFKHDSASLGLALFKCFEHQPLDYDTVEDG